MIDKHPNYLILNKNKNKRINRESTAQASLDRSEGSVREDSGEVRHGWIRNSSKRLVVMPMVEKCIFMTDGTG